MQGYDDSGAGACEVCSSGEGVLADGTCGVCPSGQFILSGACTGPSAASCGGLSPAKGYEEIGRRGVRRAVALRRWSPFRRNLREIVPPDKGLFCGGSCWAPSAASCGGLSPVMGYDSDAECVRCAQRVKLRQIVSGNGLRFR